jgi:hypothetical protein
MIPEFNSEGDLPVGIHRATLDEVLSRFGGFSSGRRIVAVRLERVYRLAAGTGHLARFVVFGSFVTNKHEPNDVDVLLIMDEEFDLSVVSGEARLLFDHQVGDSHFGASIFWVRRVVAFGGEQSMIEFWQRRRDGNLRGIVEIVG